MALGSTMRLAAVAAAVLALAGCGSGDTGSTALPSAGPSCATAGQADSLTVTRVNLFPSHGLRFTFPPRIVASSPRLAKAAARAWCSIQWPSSGAVYSCPADWGLSYRVQFDAAGRRIAMIDPDATGCQWKGMDRFWLVLGKATGVPDPATAFRGCDPHGGLPCPKNATFTA
jgi:hypothetical protein